MPKKGPKGSSQDYITAHNNAELAAIVEIENQASVAGLSGFEVYDDVVVPDARKDPGDGSPNTGEPDIVGYDPGQKRYYVWEVKITGQETSATTEAQGCVDKMNADPLLKNATLGWQIGGPYPVMLDSNKFWGFQDGAVIYGDFNARKVRAPQGSGGGGPGTSDYVKIFVGIGAAVASGIRLGGGGGNGSGGGGSPVGVGAGAGAARGPMYGGHPEGAEY